MTVSKRTVDTNYRASFYDDLCNSFKTFLRDEKGVTFYALMCDICVETGEVVVSMNTEFDYHRRLRQIESDKIRFDSNFWNYQAIVQCKPVELKLIQKYYGNDDEGLLQLVTQTVKEFTKTKTFESIRKSPDFKCLCKTTSNLTSQINL